MHIHFVTSLTREEARRSPYEPFFVVPAGMLHPKMNILSRFSHPQVVPSLNEFRCSVNHKERYLEKC